MSSARKAKRRRPNPRLVKIHRTYTVQEIATLFGMHRNTVRRWIKAGLQTIDAQRPTLVLGRHLVEYIVAQRARRRQVCGPGELYCLRCREPRRPAGGVVDFERHTECLGNVIGLCPVCDALIHRRVNVTSLHDSCAGLEVLSLRSGCEA